MGYQLARTASDQRWLSSSTWAYALALAEEHGWCPEGTVSGTEEDLGDGTYDANEGQIVTASDAANLARSIETGLLCDRLPGEPSAPRREALLDLIHFLRGGAFAIV